MRSCMCVGVRVGVHLVILFVCFYTPMGKIYCLAEFVVHPATKPSNVQKNCYVKRKVKCRKTYGRVPDTTCMDTANYRLL